MSVPGAIIHREKKTGQIVPTISVKDEFKLMDNQDLLNIALITPVSILQELLTHRGIQPFYEFVRNEGTYHEPIFRYRVSFEDKDVALTSMGTGSTKEEAMHNAAKALINEIISYAARPSGPIYYDSATILNDLEETADKNTQCNPIGWLQELCVARRYPPPSYQIESETGLSHEKEFSISCQILQYREIGVGKTKKIAKRMAAYKTWTTLQDDLLNQQQTSQVPDENKNASRFAFNSCSGDFQKILQFHFALRNTTSQKLAILQAKCANDANDSYVQVLEEIAIEHGFEVNYVDIGETSSRGLHQWLVQLALMPDAVCYGSGQSSKAAKAEAARNALEYLNLKIF